jgi:DNA-directed RNA polymerase subunit RPC12/RpoP
MTTAGVQIVSIEAFVRCPKCDSTIPLGSVVERPICGSCREAEAMPVERWRRALDAAVAAAPARRASPADADGEAGGLVRLLDDCLRVCARHAPVACAACSATLPLEAVKAARSQGRLVCPTCHAALSVRPVPPWAASALPGVTHLLAEDTTQLAGTPPPTDIQASQVPCPGCGASVAPSGARGADKCPYCSTMVVIPKWARQRLRGDPGDPHRFYLVLDPSLPRAPYRADLEWRDVEAVAVDAAGNIFAIGEDEEAAIADRHVVFALDAQLRTRWVRRWLELGDDAPPDRLFVRRDGTLVLWSSSSASALLLRGHDGVDAGRLGGREEPDSKTHCLDLRGASDVAECDDGSIVMLKNDRLARTTAQGEGIRTWPKPAGFFARLFDDEPGPFRDRDPSEPPALAKLAELPTRTKASRVHVGWDGALYLVDRDHLACFERDGKRRWLAALPDGTTYDVGGDDRGFAYFLQHTGGDARAVERVTPDGQRSTALDDRDAPAAFPRRARHLAVRPDGGVVILGDRPPAYVFSTR